MSSSAHENNQDDVVSNVSAGSPPTGDQAASGPSNIAASVAPNTAAPITAQPPAQLDPYYSTDNANFPPGRSAPGFIPSGDPRPASFAQGNRWPIDTNLRDRICMGEVDGRKVRATRLTYDQVFSKYTAWQGHVSVSTMRGQVRKQVLPPDQRRRNPVIDGENVTALLKVVPNCTDSKGNISWTQVKEAVLAETGDSFGSAALHTKWSELNSPSP